MEDLFPAIIVIVGIIGSILSTAKKEKTNKAAQANHTAAAAARLQAAQQKMTAVAAAEKSATVIPPISFADVPGQRIAPTVHPHIQPDCATHDVPGSLGVTSLEGKDPCHEDQLTLERTFAQPAQPTGGLTFDWTGDSMVKAVVMQEVLTRPTHRAR